MVSSASSKKKLTSNKSHPGTKRKSQDLNNTSDKDSSTKPRRSSSEKKSLSSADKSTSSRKSSLARNVSEQETEDLQQEADETSQVVPEEVTKKSRSSKDSEKSNGTQEVVKDEKFKQIDLPVELGEEKTKEKAKVLKSFLEHKYKVEFPPVTSCVSDSEILNPTGKRSNKQKDDGNGKRLTKEELADEADQMDLDMDETETLMKIYDKLEEGIEQAEEFFRSIGIEWSSSHQMFKVKPKKFLPAMTMIAFGPDYDDVIVCKDDEETGETQACRLSKNNKDECPKEVTAVDLNVYNDGFQAEDDSFYAYTSDSIREFFMKNIGSYVIMKPNDDLPQTVLIRIIDERDRSFEEVKKDRAEGKPKPKKPKKTKKTTSKRKSSRTEEMKTPTIEEESDEECPASGPRFYGQVESPCKSPSSVSSKQRVETETIEIFERHKVIKRLEDVKEVDDGTMAASSWCWKNQRQPMSSEYVVPPNISNKCPIHQDKPKPVIDMTNGKATALPNPVELQEKKDDESHIEQEEVTALREEKSTSIGQSLIEAVKMKDYETIPIVNQTNQVPVITQVPITNQVPAQVPLENQTPHTAQMPVQQPQTLQNQRSETRVNKINIYHGPVTVINLGDMSDDSVRVQSKPGPENKYKVQMQRKKEMKKVANDERDSQFSQEWNEFVGNFDNDKMEIQSKVRASWGQEYTGHQAELPLQQAFDSSDYRLKKYDQQTNEIFLPEIEDGYNMYESEYDRAYNQSAAKWSEFVQNAEARRSSVVGGNAATTDYVKYQNITIFGQNPPPDQEDTDQTNDQPNHDVKKPSVLLDLGVDTGKPRAFDGKVKGIELNKKVSDAQVTITLRDNKSDKKYLVNIYPEEQLKKIWSILKLNNIDVKDVTPELVIGNEDLAKDLHVQNTTVSPPPKNILDRDKEDIISQISNKEILSQGNTSKVGNLSKENLSKDGTISKGSFSKEENLSKGGTLSKQSSNLNKVTKNEQDESPKHSKAPSNADSEGSGGNESLKNSKPPSIQSDNS